MNGREVGDIEDVTPNGNIGMVTFLSIVRGQFRRTEDMLSRTEDLRKDNRDESYEKTTPPNHHVNGELFSPSQSDIFSRHTPKPADQEVRNEPGHCVCDK